MILNIVFIVGLSLGDFSAKDNGREPNAPSQRHREAPSKEVHQAAPCRARARCGLFAVKIRGFLGDSQPKLRKIVCGVLHT